MTDIVRDHYDTHAAQEQGRLDLPLCRIELASTLRLIDRYFPKSGRVCDIGGGPGRYTVELLRRGYAVTLLDLSAEEIRLAEQSLQQAGLSAEALIVGDACDLGMLPARSFDAALLMGPMYHLVESGDRARALGELRRILKPGGVAIIAYINSWGTIKTGLTDFPEWFRELDRVRSLLSDYAFVGNALTGFTECYMSTPPSALREVQEAGFDIVSYAGAESFANGMSTLLSQLVADDPAAYANVVTLAAETSEQPQYRDATDHLHIVARSRMDDK